MIELLLKVLGLAVLGYTSLEDVIDEEFNVLPVILVLTPALIQAETMSVPGLMLAICMIGVYKKFIRWGDTFPALLYAASFPSMQSIFTLVTVTGLYIALYKQAFPERQWIPYLPAILTSYIIHFLSYLLF